jgi:hypothetical protein
MGAAEGGAARALGGDPATWGMEQRAPRLPARMIGATLLCFGVPSAAFLLALGPAGLLLTLLEGLATWLWVSAQGHRALVALGATRLDEASAPRLASLVRGVAADLGMPPPVVWLVAEGGPNAFMCRARGAHHLAVTRALLEGYTRTEQEAVAAHCLLRLRRGGPWRERLAVVLGRLGPGPVVTFADDVRAAALTRYPPALISAVAKAAPADRFAAFWFVADPPSHEPADARIAQLQDL